MMRQARVAAIPASSSRLPKYEKKSSSSENASMQT